MSSHAPHKLYNTVVELNNDMAVTTTMATIQTRADIDCCSVELQSDLKLLNHLHAINDIWYIVYMEGIYEKDALLPSSGEQFLIMDSELDKCRPSYAHLSYLLQKSGFEVNMDLPGIDRPESVQHIYEEAENWIYE